MNKNEIIDILNNSDDTILEKANQIRKQYKGDEVHLRALIEFSNICRCNCLYCGLQSSNKNIERYRLKKEDIIKQANYASNLGYKTIVLQSGEDNYFSSDIMCEIISEIKKLDVALTLSIGEKTFDEYKAFKKAGADRYLLRIETTNKNLYQNLHPNASFENRVQCLLNLKTLGYETGSGSLIGLPEQTKEDIADDILFFKENNFDMIGLGPFIPHKDTPLKEYPEGNFNLSIKTMAIIRILMPDINIPATTAMETVNPMGRIIALNSGANVIMPNLTPQNCKNKYEIYPNKIQNADEPEEYLENLKSKLYSIGRTVSKDYGFRK